MSVFCYKTWAEFGRNNVRIWREQPFIDCFILSIVVLQEVLMSQKSTQSVTNPSIYSRLWECLVWPAPHSVLTSQECQQLTYFLHCTQHRNSDMFTLIQDTSGDPNHFASVTKCRAQSAITEERDTPNVGHIGQMTHFDVHLLEQTSKYKGRSSSVPTILSGSKNASQRCTGTCFIEDRGEPNEVPERKTTA
jgi:hypothetical protein